MKIVTLCLMLAVALWGQIDVYKSDQIKNLDDKYIKTLSFVLSELDLEDDFDQETVREKFTDDGFKQFINLYNAQRFIPNRVEYTIEPSDASVSTDKFYNDQVLLSGIDLKNTIADEIVVVSFDFIFDKKTGKITELRAIDPKRDYKLFLEDHVSVSSEKIIADIKRFIEQFRTFYEERNIEEIAKMYSEDAIIITGKRVNKVSQDKNVVQVTDARTGERYELTRQNKSQYVTKLRQVFDSLSKSRDYLKLTFKDVTIRQHGKYPAVFGVSLEQHWRTKRYSDVGDLFLIVDYTFPETPQIRIRTWMPSGAQKFALYDFKLN